MAITTTVATTKAIASGGVAIALMGIFNDVETSFLVISGVLASLLSYFYDWVHTHPRIFGLIQFAELLKYLFYGLAVMFSFYYVMKSIGATHVDVPNEVWGLIAAVCASSGVKIVAFISNFLPKLLNKKANL